MPEFAYCPHCTALLVEKLIDGVMRRACSVDCGFIHYDNPTPVVAAVVEYQSRIVLARNHAWPASWYGLVTGFLERGESAEQGVMREVEEELALQPQTASLIGVYPFERMNQVIIAYHVPATGSIMLNEELVDYRLIRPENIYVWPSATGLALRDFLRTRGFDPAVVEREPRVIPPA